MNQEESRVLKALNPFVADICWAGANKSLLQEFVEYVHSFPESELRECYADDYVDISRLLTRRLWLRENLDNLNLLTDVVPPVTVYDIGCGTCLQHVVFDKRIRYVGIDCCSEFKEPKFFRENCAFVRGKFSEVLPQLSLGYSVYHSTIGKSFYTSFGIANMSLAYLGGPKEMDLFDKAFSLKVVL